jgi:hypothetical protein
MDLVAEQAQHGGDVTVVGRVSGDRLKPTLGGQETEPDGIALVDEVAHVFESVADLTPAFLGRGVREGGDRRRQAAEGGGVVQLAVKVLMGFGQARPPPAR